jgi:hypothetical protein
VISVVRKPLPLSAWPLVNQAAMLEALTYLTEQGWRGALTQSAGGWTLELNADDPTRQVVAQIGDWLILDMGLRRISDDDYAANYEESGS